MRYFSFLFFVTLAVLFSFSFTLSVSAHGEEAKILETIIDPYKVTMSILPDEAVVGEELTFSFLLSDAAGTEVSYSDTFVRVDQEAETVFAGTVSAGEFGGSRMTIRLPEEGSYSAYVRFYDVAGATLVEGQLPSFDVTAPTASGAERQSGGAALLAGFIGGAVVGFLGASMWKRKNAPSAA